MCHIVIATYNEADTIGAILDQLGQYHVTVVDDNSPDGTGDIATQYPNVDLITRQSRGLASAYITGLRHALAQWGKRPVVQMDAGLSHDPADIPRFLEMHGRIPHHLITGTRFVKPIDRQYIRPRLFISLAAVMAANLIGIRVTDATCGFRCWPPGLLYNVLLEWEPKANGHVFQLEMLYRAWDISGSVRHLPIAYCPTNSSFRWSSLTEAINVFVGLAIERDRRYW